MEDRKRFRNILYLDFTKSIGRTFLLSLLLVGFTILLDSWNSFVLVLKDNFLEGSISVHYFYFNSIIYAGVFSSYFLPIISTLPYATSYIDEYNSGVSDLVMFRINKSRYCISKFINAIITGGFAISMGLTLIMTLLLLKLPLITENRIVESEIFPYFNFLIMGNGVEYYLIAIYRAFLTGAMWASTARKVDSSWTKKSSSNSYLATL